MSELSDKAVKLAQTANNIAMYQEIIDVLQTQVSYFQKKLKDGGIITDDDIANIEAQVKEVVERAVRFADESPLPDPSELYTDVYANPLN